jgi:hypothetical protein
MSTNTIQEALFQKHEAFNIELWIN